MAQKVMDASIKPGDVVAGKYRVESILGGGGMGVVVAARHLVLDDRVALKFLLPEIVESEEARARFIREAQAAAQIKNAHIAHVLDVGTLENGLPFMVMELLDGVDLAALIRTEGVLDQTLACLLTLQTCEALAAAHAAKIVHRDVKPSNLFITRLADGSPHVKMLDFGISKVAGSSDSSLTRTHTMMGSPFYMSPEQLRSTRSVDSRTDIWSLGVVLFEALTGAVPFRGEAMPQLVASILESTAPPLCQSRPEIRPEVDAVVQRCLQRAPQDRFANVAEIAEALAPFAGEGAPAQARRVRRIVEQPSRPLATDSREGASSKLEVAAVSATPERRSASGAGASGEGTPTFTSFGSTREDSRPRPSQNVLPLRYLALALGGLTLGGVLVGVIAGGPAPAPVIDPVASNTGGTLPVDPAEREQQYQAALKEGRACHAKKDYDGAIKAFQRALDLWPDDPRALSELGWTALQKKDFDLAETSLEKALERPSERELRGQILYNLGRAQEERGQTAAAIQSYQASLLARPNQVVEARMKALRHQ